LLVIAAVQVVVVEVLADVEVVVDVVAGVVTAVVVVAKVVAVVVVLAQIVVAFTALILVIVLKNVSIKHIESIKSITSCNNYLYGNFLHQIKM